MVFAFKTDKESVEFVLEVAKLMSNGFGLSNSEALSMINAHWKGIDFTGSEHVIYHETATYFANEIYFGHESYWWLDEEVRSSKGLKSLEIKPIAQSWG